MRKKNNGKRFNTILGSWYSFQLEQFIEYKAQESGKIVRQKVTRISLSVCSNRLHG
jgi:transposase